MRKSMLATFFVLLASSFASIHADQVRPVGQAGHFDHHIRYGSFYTKSNDLVPPEHAINFDKESVKMHGIDHIPGTGDFFIKEPGIYRVSYGVSLSCPGMIALTLDENVIPGSEIYVSEANELTTHTMLVKITGKTCCEYKLNLINNYPLCDNWWEQSFKLYSGDQTCCDPKANITASITIERVTDIDSCCGCGG